jgi:hypothetical protein
MPKQLLFYEQVGPEFLSQGTAIDAEYAGSLALVALRVVHDGFEQGSFNLADNQIIQIARPIAVERCKVLIECIFCVFAKRFLAFPGRKVLLIVLFLGHVA